MRIEFILEFTSSVLENKSKGFHELNRTRRPTELQKKERQALKQEREKYKNFKKETINIDLEGELSAQSFIQNFIAKTLVGSVYCTYKTDIRKKVKINYHKKNILPEKAFSEILFDFGLTFISGTHGHYNVFTLNSKPDVVEKDSIKGTLLTSNGIMHGKIDLKSFSR